MNHGLIDPISQIIAGLEFFLIALTATLIAHYIAILIARVQYTSWKKVILVPLIPWIETVIVFYFIGFFVLGDSRRWNLVNFLGVVVIFAYSVIYYVCVAKFYKQAVWKTVLIFALSGVFSLILLVLFQFVRTVLY